MLAIVPECFKYFDKRRPVLFGQAPGAFQEFVKGPRGHPGSRFDCGNGKELHTGVREKLKDGVCDCFDKVLRALYAVFKAPAFAVPLAIVALARAPAPGLTYNSHLLALPA